MRLVEDDWEQPTLGAWGLGWEVWCDGMEITQWTYFQQLGGFDVELVPAEMTYGLERLAMFLQGKRTAFELEWAPGVTWGDVYRENERAVVEVQLRGGARRRPDQALRRVRGRGAAPARARVADSCVRPGAQVLAHVQPARRPRAISVTERAAYIGRVRKLARGGRRGVPGVAGAGCRRCCLRSGSRSCLPPPATRPRRSCPSSPRAHLGH